MRRMDRAKSVLLAALALALVLGSTAVPSMSYFTTYVTANGSKVLELHGTDIKIDEEVDSNVKSVRVKSTGETECYARVKVFCPLQETVPEVLAFTSQADGAGTWEQGSDGYWYYSEPIAPGDLSATLKIEIDMERLKAAGLGGQDLDVVVVAECAPVLYDGTGAKLANGPAYKGWTLTPTVKEG